MTTIPEFVYLDDRSRKNLATAHSEWTRIILDIAPYFPLSVIQGYRGKKEQDRLYNMGNSKVMWPDSKHNVMPSLAIDVIPQPLPHEWGDHDWRERVKFYQLGILIQTTAMKYGHLVRSGYDWDQDGDYRDQSFNDLVHHELQINAWNNPYPQLDRIA